MPLVSFWADKDPVELLASVRTMPQKDFDQLISMIQARPGRGKGKGSGPQGEYRHQAMIDLLTQVREMSDAEFKEKAEKLQQDLAGLLPPPDGRGPEQGRRGGRGMEGGRGPGEGPMEMEGPMRGPMGGPRDERRFIHEKLIHLILLSDSFYNSL